MITPSASAIYTSTALFIPCIDLGDRVRARSDTTAQTADTVALIYNPLLRVDDAVQGSVTV